MEPSCSCRLPPNWDIDTIFTLVGDHLNEVLAAAARAGMRIVDMRHESGVTHAADAWARIHRRPALSLVTGGPGHTNSLTGIATANLAGSPLIAVSGSRPRGLADRQAFQDIDQVGMARPVVKWAAEVPSAGGDSVLSWTRLRGGQCGTARRGAPDDSSGCVYGKRSGRPLFGPMGWGRPHLVPTSNRRRNCCVRRSGPW